MECYRFPKSHIVLSCIYLIVRMRMEEQRGDYTSIELIDKYVTSLSKSNNLIFYDNLGVNELFGDYLSQLSTAISDLIDCLQFVGQGLSTFKALSFNVKGRHTWKSHEHQLSVYESTAEMYHTHEASPHLQ